MVRAHGEIAVSLVRATSNKINSLTIARMLQIAPLPARMMNVRPTNDSGVAD